jgi:glycogen operon protein
MTLPVSPGAPEPLGVTPDAHGVNVAVYSAQATAIEFCLFDGDGAQQTHSILLPARTGEVFHAHLGGVAPGARYGLRAHGPDAPHMGHRFNPAKLLVDPYALALDRAFVLDALTLGFGAQRDADSAAVVPKAIVTSREDLATPLAGVRVPWGETVLYELHVRGFTRLHPDIPEALRGTFAALAEPAAIAHLVGLGITTVELMPAAAWIDERHLPPLGLTDYWGYNPVALMAPDPRLAPGGWPEIRRAVDALHGAGLEVILDVVLNHSGESDEFGPTLSLRGLDNASYYRLGEGGRYINDMGCGNCLALHRPAVVRLAMDSLRAWVELGGVDGFRFDLATALGRGETGFDPAAPLLAAIAQDPVLRAAKLIAEPWDIGPGGYQIGRFPAAFGEWNDRFRDDVRRYWRGDGGMRGALATRLAGSADLFAAKRRASRSVNFITAHDGFTLADLVSYAHKHNAANGEHNRDGTDGNFSWNHGEEGASEDAARRSMRARDQRNLLATLLLARGTPMLSMGAELGATQRGNNNAYAQDNATTWLDWVRADHALLTFTQRLIALRRAHPALRAEAFLTGAAQGESGLADVEWRTAQGPLLRAQDWHEGGEALVAVLSAAAEGGGVDRVALVLNPGGEALALSLPEVRENHVWQRVLDTADATESTVAARSVVLFAETPVAAARSGSGSARAGDARLLPRLAAAAGIAPEWWDIAGNRYAVSAETQLALLSAMGLPAATGADARDSLERLAQTTTRRLLPVAHLVYAGEDGVLPVACDPCAALLPGALTLRDDSGALVATLRPSWAATHLAADALGRPLRIFRLALPRLDAGRYIACFDAAAETLCHLTAAPRHCYLPPGLDPDLPGPVQRRFGVALQSYALRRAGDAGIGDFGALGEFAAGAARHGAALLGIQPLHMLFPAERERASPYHPSDRRYLDPIHLDLEALSAVPGFADAAPLPGAAQAGGRIDYAAVWAGKSRFLAALFAQFEFFAQTQPTHPMVQDFHGFIAEGGAQLQGFADFQAISALYPGTPWQAWPAPLRRAGSAQLRDFLAPHAAARRYAMFQQFLCDRQLAAAVRGSGLALGLYRDLAVGCAPDGAEAWANAEVFAQGVSIGAPPDPLGPEGQVWNLPPPNPLAWAQSDYAPFRAAIAANMRHAGALRIDHVLGLARLFWVPDGGTALQGAYVHYPLGDLVGHLALASQEAKCLVVGEDLGTVPDGLRQSLAAAKILSYRVMMLERTGQNFVAPRLYPARALTCAATHDLPPLAGWWRGTDLAERLALGLMDEAAYASQRAFREAEKKALEHALAADGIALDATAEETLSEAASAAIHQWLGGAPSVLLMVQAEDLAGEEVSQNLPGTNLERPNWRHCLPATVAQLFASSRARRCFEALAARRSPGGA